MGKTDTVARAATPETICTRVVARVIEELSCIEIAPDSPTWSDLCSEGEKVGQLAIYRGRSGVLRMVAFDARCARTALDVHYVVVLTEPQSLVPHLCVSAWSHAGSAPQVHADLLPRAPLGRCTDYQTCCYGPLRSIRERTLRDSRLRELALGPLQREWGSPLALACAAASGKDLAPAAACVDAYTDHWARLMRQGTPFAAQRDAEAALSGARHDAAQREALFTRHAEALWEPLEATLGAPAVDMLLAALRDGTW